MNTNLISSPIKEAVREAQRLLSRSGIFELRRNLLQGFTKLKSFGVSSTDWVPLYVALRRMGRDHLRSLNEIYEHTKIERPGWRPEL